MDFFKIIKLFRLNCCNYIKDFLLFKEYTNKYHTGCNIFGKMLNIYLARGHLSELLFTLINTFDTFRRTMKMSESEVYNE